MRITFDDGFELEREGVLTLLDDLRIPAVFYLIGSTLDNRNLMWRNQLFAMAKTHPDRFKEEYQKRHGPTENPAAQAMSWPPAKVDEFCSDLWVAVGMPPIGDYLAEHQPYFSEGQVRNLLSAGHEVGWHTETHQNCALLTEEEAEEEITKPAEAFKAKYNLSRLSFAYPYGLRHRAGAHDAEWTSQLRNSVGAGSERSDVPRSPDKAPFYAVLGTEGLRPATTPPHQWERLDIETDLIAAVYERPGMDRLKQILRRNP